MAASCPVRHIPCPGRSPLLPNGQVNGLGGNDILIGDPGGTTIAPGDRANFVLVLDRSGSMTTQISFGSGTISRLQAMKNAVNDLINDLAASNASDVRIHLVTFDSNSSPGSTYDLVRAAW